MLVVNQKENSTVLSFYKLRHRQALNKYELELDEIIVFDTDIFFEPGFEAWLSGELDDHLIL